ncbi:centromere protein X isoform X3 [Peromyscus maniculatus bairdii]|uniref:centromere protein X isoform X3 n=1 Tax=Peromyscus maniculatus bairdii TaxID=230844 RepID=UPI003FD3499A
MEEETSGFRKELVSRLLHLHFRDCKTKVSGDALQLMAELLRIFVIGDCCPWGVAGPVRGPRCCQRGSAGEGASSAAAGLLEIAPVSCQVSDEFTSALTSRTKFSSFQRMGRSRQLLPSLAIASGVLVRQVQGKVDQPAHSHSHPPPSPSL